MRILLLLKLLLLVAFSVKANMAEPVDPGSTAASPFISSYVDVLHEDIIISIDAAFQRAEYRVTYLIKSDTSGRQIPLLFYADALTGPMSVLLDGAPIVVEKVDEGFPNYGYTDDGSFRSYFDSDYGVIQFTKLPESPARLYCTDYNNFRYFTVDLAAGEHEIVVSYAAKPWVDRWESVKEYSFHYALSPAKYWRSFGTLDVRVELEDSTQIITSNLDSLELSHSGDSVSWSFTSLPTDIMEIRWQPELGWFKSAALDYGPLVLALLVFVFLLAAQLYLIRSRNKLVNVIYSFVGATSVTIFWILSYDIVDGFVGPHASAFHGYLFIVIIFPLIWLVYGALIWLGFTLKST